MSAWLIVCILMQPDFDVRVAESLHGLDSKKFKERERRSLFLYATMRPVRSFSYGHIIKIRWYHWVNRGRLSLEAGRRLSAVFEKVWDEYCDVRPTHYWKIPCISDKESLEGVKPLEWVAKAGREGGEGLNSDHSQEYIYHRIATRMVVRKLLRDGWDRQDVIRLLDRWAAEEIQWYMAHCPSYFFAETRERMEK